MLRGVEPTPQPAAAASFGRRNTVKSSLQDELCVREGVSARSAEYTAATLVVFRFIAAPHAHAELGGPGDPQRAVVLLRRRTDVFVRGVEPEVKVVGVVEEARFRVWTRGLVRRRIEERAGARGEAPVFFGELAVELQGRADRGHGEPRCCE